MSILIDKVRILNFRSIKECSIDLTPISLLIGANNSGKTSFLRALNLALGVGAKRITKEDFYIGKDENNSDEKEIIIDIRIIPVNESGKRTVEFNDTWREKQFGDLINLDGQDNQFFSFRTRIKYDPLKGEYPVKRFKIKVWKDEAGWEKQKHEEDLKLNFVSFPLFFIDAQRDIIQDLRDRTSYFGRLINEIKIDDKLIKEIEDKIKEINESIVSGSGELEFLKEELMKLKDTITSGAEIEINPVNKKIRDIGKSVNINFQDTSSESFPLDYHGMGTRSWASLLTYGAFISWQYKKLEAGNQPYHAILALEEPEAHLHPHAQRTLYKQLSGMKGQKIISTHSPFIASQCGLHEIRHFKKEMSFTEIKSLELSNLATDDDQRKLKRQVLNTRGELLFARAVVLFEGETEEQALPIFAEKYWGKHPYEMGISFIGVGGQNYKPFLKLISSFNLNGFIFSDGEERTVTNVHKQIDEVFQPNSGDIKKLFLVFIPNNHNLEEYLIYNGFADSIMNAVKAIEGEGFVSDYIDKNQGRSISKQKTANICDKCNQNIYEDRLRDYKGSDGEKNALLDIIIKSKTKYAQKIAEEICKQDLPAIIIELFKKVETIFGPGVKS